MWVVTIGYILVLLTPAQSYTGISSSPWSQVSSLSTCTDPRSSSNFRWISWEMAIDHLLSRRWVFTSDVHASLW